MGLKFQKRVIKSLWIVSNQNIKEIGSITVQINLVDTIKTKLIDLRQQIANQKEDINLFCVVIGQLQHQGRFQIF